MSTRTTSLALAVLAVGALGTSTTAIAATAHTPDAAMRKGIRDYARSADATASRVAVDCAGAARVGAKAPCTGTFRLTAGAAHADYRLTSGARVLRLSPNALEYRVVARTARAADGLPKRIAGFGGFLQQSR